MKRLYRFKLKSLLYALFLAPLTLVAQEKAPISVNLRTFGVGTSLPKIYVRNGQKPTSTQLGVRAFFISEPVHYTGLNELTFYVAETPDEFIEAEATSESAETPKIKVYSGVAGDKKKPLIIAKVNLPGRCANYLLLWARIGPDRYQVMAVPDDPVAQPADSLRFLNLTSAPMKMAIQDGEILELSPGEARVVPTRGREVFFFRAKTGTAEDSTGFISNVVETRKGLRRTVLFLVSTAPEVGGSSNQPIFSFFTFTNPVDLPKAEEPK